ncbi:MAG: lytic murein transglycosylase [Candidatus Kapaibacterium sp.]
MRKSLFRNKFGSPPGKFASNPIITFMVVVAAIVISTVKISYSIYTPEDNEHKIQFFQPVINKLVDRGADSAFVYDLITHPSVEFNEKFTKINVTGYLSKPDYSSHYNDFSVSKTGNFLRSNITLLRRAEKKFGVAAEVIASVLWIETRHGGYLGDNHIPSVFLSTAMAAEPEFIEMNKKSLRSGFNGTDEELAELETKIEKRSMKKSNWAIGELLALQKISKRLPISIYELRGSWAGAFGMSQFLPSSYQRWAVDGDGDGAINLFGVEDAVFSVANYLKTNGWGPTEKQRRKAVFHYNNSSAYVDAVLTLAEKVAPPERFDIHTPLSRQIKQLRL